MLCQLTEARKVETLAVLVCADVIVCLSLQEVCYHYWPSGSTQTYGEFTVEVLGEENFQGFSQVFWSIEYQGKSLSSSTEQ